MKFEGKTFLPARQALTNKGTNFGANFGANFGNFVSNFVVSLSETSFSRRAVLMIGEIQKGTAKKGTAKNLS